VTFHTEGDIGQVERAAEVFELLSGEVGLGFVEDKVSFSHALSPPLLARDLLLLFTLLKGFELHSIHY